MSQFDASTPLLETICAPGVTGNEQPLGGAFADEACVLAALAEQADIVVNEKKVKKARPSAKAGISAEAKQRAELATAMARGNMIGAESLLDDGCDPNFLILRTGVLASPLALACRNHWVEGVALLIERGAQESLAQAQYAEESGKSKEELREIMQQQSEQWKVVHDRQIFEALMTSETDENQLKVLAQSISRDSGKALFVLNNKQEHLPTQKAWEDVEKLAWGQLQHQAMLARPLSPPAVMLRFLWARFPEILRKDNDDRWAAIVRGNRAELLSFLAKSGAGAPQDWAANAVAADFDMSNGYAPESLVRRLVDAAGREKIIFEPNATIKIGLLTLAVLAGSADCVAILGRCEPLLRRAQQDPDAARWMASGAMSSKKLPMLREAQKAGLDLATFVNGKGETPLHGLCRHYKVSKTAFFEMARVCPAWMSKKGSDGQTPVELLTQKHGRGDHHSIQKAVAQIEALWMRKDMREVKAEIREEIKAAKKAAPKNRKKSAEVAVDAPVAKPAEKRPSRRL